MRSRLPPPRGWSGTTIDGCLRLVATGHRPSSCWGGCSPVHLFTCSPVHLFTCSPTPPARAWNHASAIGSVRSSLFAGSASVEQFADRPLRADHVGRGRRCDKPTCDRGAKGKPARKGYIATPRLTERTPIRRKVNHQKADRKGCTEHHQRERGSRILSTDKQANPYRENDGRGPSSPDRHRCFVPHVEMRDTMRQIPDGQRVPAELQPSCNRRAGHSSTSSMRAAYVRRHVESYSMGM